MGLALTSSFFYRALSAMCFFFSNFETSFAPRAKEGGFFALGTSLWSCCGRKRHLRDENFELSKIFVL